MKKTALLICLVLILSACGNEAAPPTGTPGPTETPLPTPSPSPSPQPDAIYGEWTDFEVSSTWKAEDFGDDCGALLTMSEEEDGEIAFALYFYQLTQTEPPLYISDIVICRFSATASFDGDGYYYWLEGWRHLDGLYKFDGHLMIDGDTATLSYNVVEPGPWSFPEFMSDAGGTRLIYTYETTYVSYPPDMQPGFATPTSLSTTVTEEYEITINLPTRFSRVAKADEAEVWYDMPLYQDEAELPMNRRALPGEIESIMGTPTESERSVDEFGGAWGSYLYESSYGTVKIYYSEWKNDEGERGSYITSLSSTDPRYAPKVRGIKIGDSAAVVLDRFLNTVGSFEEVSALIPFDSKVKQDFLGSTSDDETHQGIYLYGDFGANFRIEFEHGTATVIHIHCGNEGLQLYLDESECVREIVYRNYN